MTVRELIDKLLLLPKELPVLIMNEAGELVPPYVSENIVGEGEEEMECVLFEPDPFFP